MGKQDNHLGGSQNTLGTVMGAWARDEGKDRKDGVRKSLKTEAKGILLDSILVKPHVGGQTCADHMGQALWAC